MQTRNYRARQSGNLARKVRNADHDPGSTALIIYIYSYIIIWFLINYITSINDKELQYTRALNEPFDETIFLRL